jgi:predicted DNA-binding ribbon-helix-helix protein
LGPRPRFLEVQRWTFAFWPPSPLGLGRQHCALRGSHGFEIPNIGNLQFGAGPTGRARLGRGHSHLGGPVDASSRGQSDRSDDGAGAEAWSGSDALGATLPRRSRACGRGATMPALAAAMKFPRTMVARHSIRIGGHQTTVSLEGQFWEALREIATERGTSLQGLVTSIRAERRGPMSSSLRLFVLEHYQNQIAARRPRA